MFRRPMGGPGGSTEGMYLTRSRSGSQRRSSSLSHTSSSPTSQLSYRRWPSSLKQSIFWDGHTACMRRLSTLTIREL